MSRKQLVGVVALIGLILVVVSAGRVGPAIGRRLLELHGIHPTGETTHASGEIRGDGWPDTPAGAVANGWVLAFSTGEPAMRAFLEANVSPADLAKRSIPERIERYRDLHERFGALMLAAVDTSTPYQLTATLLAEDGSRHQIEFTVASGSPHTLQSVGVYEQVRVGHGSHP